MWFSPLVNWIVKQSKRLFILFKIFSILLIELGLPRWLRRWRICLHWWRTRSDSWVGKIPWRREGLPTPVFLPGEFHGQRNLVGYSPWGHKELDTTEWLSFHFTLIDDSEHVLSSFYLLSTALSSVCNSSFTATSQQIWAWHYYHPQLYQKFAQGYSLMATPALQILKSLVLTSVLLSSLT